MLEDNRIRKYYDEYHRQESKYGLPQGFYRQFLDYLKVEKGRRLLDIGCGRGQILKEAERKQLFSCGIDISFEGLEFAKKIIKKSHIVCGNAEYLPYPNNIFDYIVMLGTLEHFLNPTKGLKEAVRVLSNGGKICIVVPNLYYIKHFWNIWTKKKTPSTDQIIEHLKPLKEWESFFRKSGLFIINVLKDNHILYYIGPKTSFLKKMIKFIIRPFLFLLPLRLSYQFIFICEKSLKENGNIKRKN